MFPARDWFDRASGWSLSTHHDGVVWCEGKKEGGIDIII